MYSIRTTAKPWKFIHEVDFVNRTFTLTDDQFAAARLPRSDWEDIIRDGIVPAASTEYESFPALDDEAIAMENYRRNSKKVGR